MTIEIIPTQLEPGHVVTTHPIIENYVEIEVLPSPLEGLLNKYSVKYNPDVYNNQDFPWYPIAAGPGRHNAEFSIDNQRVLTEYLLDSIKKNPKIHIMEIGVHRNKYQNSSTGMFCDHKRPHDVYIGVDIVDKSFLNDATKNIHTIQSSSLEIEAICAKLKAIANIGTEPNEAKIDILMIDGHHCINNVYAEWEYTKLLASNGIVLFHDTNSHPGPYFILKSIDPSKYTIKKYLNDVVDWGISAAIKKS